MNKVDTKQGKRRLDRKHVALRNAMIVKLYNDGWSAPDLAGVFYLSRQMVLMIIKKHE